MPFCHICGSELESGAMFCEECGTPSKENKTAGAAASQHVIKITQEELDSIQPGYKPKPVKEVKPKPVSKELSVLAPLIEPVDEELPMPVIEETPVQSFQDSSYTDLSNTAEAKNIPVAAQPVKPMPVPGAERVSRQEPVRGEVKPKKSMVPVLVTVCSVCVAVIVALAFVIVFILKKGKNDNVRKPTEWTDYDDYDETDPPETTAFVTTEETTTTEEPTTEETTTEETTTEVTRETERPTETEKPETTPKPKATETTEAAETVAGNAKFKVSNAVSKKLDAAQYGTYVYKVPKITINGLNTDEANQKMKDDLSEYLVESGEPYQVTHTHYSNKNFVVIMVYCEKHSPPAMTRVYTISLKTGKIMTGSEIVKMYGITDKHFFKQVKATYNKVDFYCGGSESDLAAIRKTNLSRVSFKYITPYIGKKGHLSFVGYCDYYGNDSPGYIRFDATEKKLLTPS